MGAAVGGIPAVASSSKSDRAFRGRTDDLAFEIVAVLLDPSLFYLDAWFNAFSATFLGIFLFL